MSAAVESSARNEPVRQNPLASPVLAYLERLHASYASVADGAVATYIPELAQANPESFGICLATMDGHVCEVGDTREPFTIQSISKPLTYGIALEEWCEERLLGSDGGQGVAAVVLREHELLRGLAPAQLDRLQPLLRRRVFERGALIARKGDRAREIYLVTEGKLSVVVERPDGETRRLATLGPGTVFGELAAVGGEARTADVRADTAVECYELALDDLDRLDATDPSLRAAVLTNLLHSVTRLARRLDAELELLRA